jgi:ABC-type Fe3+-hydroxamate transport system substrate-binding protein
MKTIRLRDDGGTLHEFDTPPRRIVSLVPSLTESIITLGCGDRLVGVTEWCVRPEEVVKSIPKVRGTKNPFIKRILELDPDLVLANREENRRRHIEELQQHVPVFLTYPRTVFDALKTIKDLGLLLDVVDSSVEIIEASEFLLGEIHRTADPYFHSACMIWHDPWMAVGPDTYIHDLIGHFGFVNVFKDDDRRYPETTLDELAELEPEIVLLPTEPYEFGEVEKKEIQLAMWRTVPDCRVVIFDGSYLTWWGTRTLLALRFLAELRAGLVERRQ